MSVKPWLTQVGKFPVEYIGGIPHFNQDVSLEAPRTAVLHTTEGGWDGSLAVFKTHYAPHFLVGPSASSGARIAQLVQIGTIGAALVTHNWVPLVQVEVVGYSKESPWMFDDATAEAVAALMAVCKAEYGIPLARHWPDGVYGMARANDPHRNGGQFGKVAGWYGHGDVPSPDSHWDPGCLQWSKLFAMAGAMPESDAPPTPAPPAPPRPCCGGQTFDLTTDAGLQEALGALGYAVDLTSAVRAFQAHDGGLAVDGDPGPATRNAIEKALAQIAH